MKSVSWPSGRSAPPNQLRKKILRMRPNHGWSLACCLHRNPTPYSLRAGSGNFRGTRISHGLPLGCVRVRRSPEFPDKKFGLAITLRPKAGCWLKAPDFSSPSRFCPVPGFFSPDWSLENAPFYPHELPMSLKRKECEKRKFLRFMTGTGQRRLLAGSPEFSDPLPPRYFLLTPVFVSAAGATVNGSARGASASAVARSLEIGVGWVTIWFVRHG